MLGRVESFEGGASERSVGRGSCPKGLIQERGACPRGFCLAAGLRTVLPAFKERVGRLGGSWVMRLVWIAQGKRVERHLLSPSLRPSLNHALPPSTRQALNMAF